MEKGLRKRLKRLILQIKYAWGIRGDNVNLKTEALILSHSLEKCMGVKNPEIGRGIKKALRLADIIGKIDQSSFAYKEAVAVLKAYVAFQNSNNTDVSDIERMVKNILNTECAGGCYELGRDELEKGINYDFESFVKARHSVRYFSQDSINKNEIEKAIKIARNAPSACNRQPWKFYYSLDKKICKEISELIPRQSFLDEIPYFGVVTVDRTCFNPDEIGQWDVNGGIFLSYLILAFHSLGIASCCFQIPKSIATNKKAKGLGIDINNEIIAVVGYGRVNETVTCLKAQRRPENEIAIQI